MPQREAVARLANRKFGPWVLGIDQKTDPQNLPDGKCADAQNLLLDEVPGALIKRCGLSLASTLPSGNPARDVFTFGKSDGSSFLMASDGTTLYYTTDPTAQDGWSQLFTGLDDTAFMEFETAEDKCWMTNFSNYVMSFDGSDLVIYDRSLTWTQNATSITTSGLVSNDLTQADNYWVGQKLVFTTGANQGYVVTITAYTQGDNTLVWTPALPNSPDVTDQWQMGLVIPQVRMFRYWDGHLFGAGYAANSSGIQFHRNFDPNTGDAITIDHPLAWPPTYQINAYSNDEDRIWVMSPILRDRVMVAKQNWIGRIERDPLLIYRIEVISRNVGSRFHRSWVEKPGRIYQFGASSGLLYFLGQATDGYPDVFKTDMVNIVPVDTVGGFEPLLRSLKQPNAILENVIITSKADFDDGTLSSTARAQGNGLEVGSFGTDAAWNGSQLVAASNIDLDSTPGVAAILGSPIYTERYEATVLPTAAGWTQYIYGEGAGTITQSAKNLNMQGGGEGAATGSTYYRTGVLSAQNDSYLTVTTRDNTGSQEGFPTVAFGMANGTNGVWVGWNGSSIQILDGNNGGGGFGNDSFGATTYAGPGAGFHTFNLLLKSTGVYKLWIDGALVVTGTAFNFATPLPAASWGPGKYWTNASITTNHVVFGIMGVTAYGGLVPPVPGNGDFQAVYYHTNFRGDQLNSYGGAVSPTSMPSNLPTSGMLTMLNDATRAPDALQPLWAVDTPQSLLAVCGTTSASTTVQLGGGANMEAFMVGMEIDLRTTTTGALIANGLGRTITAINVGAGTITIADGGGNVNTDGTCSVYLFSGTAAMKSWTASGADFGSDADPSGYVSVANGATPSSEVLEYQRVQTTLTAQAVGNGPGLSAIYTGTLWLSAPISIGSNIAAWRTFVDTLVTQTDAAQNIKIRGATVSGTPTEADWGAWSSVLSSGDNIGTALDDTTPPSDIWVQLKVEQGVNSSGQLPSIVSMVVQWTVGSANILPLMSIVHKRRWLTCCASASSLNNDTIVVNDRNDAWMRYAGWALNGFVHFKSNFVGFDANNANVYLLDVDNLYSDNGAAIDAFLLTRMDNFGDLYIRKNLRFSYILPGPQAFSLTASYQRPGDSGQMCPWTCSFIGDGQSVRQNFGAATIARAIQRKYENAVAGQSMYLIGEEMFYDRRPLQP